MKLRNKKTGIIGELHFVPDKEYHFTVVTEDPADVMIYKKLADLYADWEDYEEPKEYYAIDLQVDIIRWARHSWDEKTTNKIKEIGNYFETKEEADLAVEKLKAWKRLKDKGFRFDNFVRDAIYFNLDGEQIQNKSILKDLDLLFGGEE